MDLPQEKIAWRKVKYSQKFLNAFRGMHIVWKTTRHSFLHILSGLAAIFLGLFLKVSNVELILIIFAIGLVFVSEAFNTAIEIDIDLTSPEYHPFAKDTKDVAAAAVVLSMFVAGIIGAIIFLPKLFELTK